MDRKILKKQIILGTILAIMFAFLIYFFAGYSFVLSLLVLLFSWPVTEIIIEKIASTIPGSENRITISNWKIPLFTIFVLLLIGLIVYWFSELTFFKSLAITILIGAPAGALNGIVMEWEDIHSGGFNNPK
jgi:hypothetical protein